MEKGNRTCPIIFYFVFLYLILSCSLVIAKPIELKQVQPNEEHSLSAKHILEPSKLYYFKIVAKQYSELSVNYSFISPKIPIFQKGGLGLKMYVREENSLVEVRGRQTLNGEQSLNDVESEDVVFSFAPGVYRVYFTLSYYQQCALCSSYSSSWEKLPENQGVLFDIELKEKGLVKKHTWISSLDRWLVQTGLSKFYAISDVSYSKNNSELTGINRDSVNLLNQSPLANPEDAERLIVKFNDSIGRRPVDDGSFYSMSDRDWNSEIQRKYSNIMGMSIDKRIRTKIALLSNKPIYSIILKFPTIYCEYCLMSTSSREIDKIGAGFDFSIPEALTFTDEKLSFDSRILAVLTDMAEKKQGQLSILETSEDYVEVVLSGAKGLVIDSEKVWELVQIVASLQELEDRYKIRLFVDGLVASGIGQSAPNRSRYQKSMEPEYTGELVEFTKKTLDKILHAND